MYESRTVRRMFGRKKDEVTESWRKLRNEELHDLFSPASIVRLIKSRKIRWTWNLLVVGRRKMHLDYWLETRRERERERERERPLGRFRLMWVDKAKGILRR
jgi:hypothetical protein